MNISILTVGSRGDVQPFLALAVGLRAAGHSVNYAANPEFIDFIESRGIKFDLIRNNPMDILKDEYKDTPYKERRKIYYHFMTNWINDGIEAAKNSDLIIFTPVYHVGYHVAQKLEIPVVKCSYVPYTPTKEFPNPFLKSVPAFLNKTSYLVSQFFEWQIIKKNINKLRKELLDLKPIPFYGLLHKQHKEKMPVIYGYSESVIPRPKDWPGWIYVTGYWFLKDLESYSPAKELEDFINNGSQPLFFDIGSLGQYSEQIISKILSVLLKTEYRIVANPGGADISKLNKPGKIFFVDGSVPHAWILPKVKAVISHGGPGTVAAVLRAGKPLTVVPTYGDHRFWGNRVHSIGAGTVPLFTANLTDKQILMRVNELMTNNTLRENAEKLGEKIRNENGVEKAVKVIENLMRGKG